MDKKLREILKRNSTALKASDKNLKSIYEIMFSGEELVLCEFNDGFRIKKQTYGEINAEINRAAAAIYEKIGATHNYVALEIDNSPKWIIAFWAILKSGNKPYLVNLRYPQTLTEGILKTLKAEYVISDVPSSLSLKNVLVSELDSGVDLPDDVFEDEIAFSSSATSMNEVVCFYSGFQIAEQILNFESIIKAEPRMAKHYKGSLKQLAFLPFYHVFGLFAVYFWFTFFGRTLVFLRDYSADTILKTCKRHEVTHIFAVPALWHTVEKQIIKSAKEQGEKKYNKLQKGLKFTTFLQNVFPSFGQEISKSIMSQVTHKLFGKSVMFCINGGSYLRDSAMHLLNGIGYSMHNGYGMSEIGITSVELRRKAKERNLNSIGKPFNSVEYKLDENGVLWVKGSSLCTKKLKNGLEEEKNEWFNTGDIMSCVDGSYYIKGRIGDVVIGENGENVNPDTVEKLFNINGIKALSVLGLKGENGEELSIVISLNPYFTESSVNAIVDEVYKINDTLPTAMAVKRFYFTFDELCPPTAIKVSRTQLKRKIELGEVKLTPFGEIKVVKYENGNSPLMEKVKEIIAEVLDVKAETIKPTDHIFYDLEGSSIQYFSILSKLSESFEITNYSDNDKYCYTVTDICEYIERHL